MKTQSIPLGKYTHLVHPEDFRQDTYDKLLETVDRKQEVVFRRGIGTLEYGYISSENERGVFVKFSHDLLGFLYTEDAWEATTSKFCDREQIEYVSLLQELCREKGVALYGFMMPVILTQYLYKKVADEDLRRFSKEQLKTYIEGLYLSGQFYANDWVAGHELLKSLGFVEKERDCGHRKFISLVYEPQIEQL